MLVLENISFSYGSKTVLENIHLSLEQGTIAAIIGESGCGKSTLLDLIYGLLQEQQGTVHYNGEQLLGANHHLIPGHEMMKYVPQEFDLMPFTTVFENVGEHVSLQMDHRKVIIEEMLTLVGMQEYATRKVKTLSGGQKQRVAIAKALAQQPKVLLMDEPFSNIDNFRKNELRRSLFSHFKKNQITCLIATHDKDDVLAFTDCTMVLQNGKMIDNRLTSEVYAHPITVYGASLFDDVNVIPARLFDNKEELLCYPHALQIGDHGLKALVVDCYFQGDAYLLKLQHDAHTFFVRHTSAVEKNTVVYVALRS